MNKQIHLSVIIPAYNEEKAVGNTIETMRSFLKGIDPSFEIIIGDDGSSDRTAEIVKEKMKKYKNVRLVQNDTNKGKGAILRNCFAHAKGEFQLFIDTDLTIDINLIPVAIGLAKVGYDVTIASKYLPGSNVVYPLTRKVFSKAFGFLTRRLLRTRIRDHQCGLKCFKKEAIKKILPHLRTNGFLIDTEMLVIAERAGLKILEFPARVNPQYFRKSKVRIFKDAWIMGIGLLKLRNRLKNNHLFIAK